MCQKHILTLEPEHLLNVKMTHLSCKWEIMTGFEVGYLKKKLNIPQNRTYPPAKSKSVLGSRGTANQDL